MTPFAGVLVVDKPLAMTSMHVCRIVRRRLINGGMPKSVKVGHGGTLDPLATGVLVVLMGKATRLCDAIMAGEKRYLAEVDLAQTSPTDDYEGPMTAVEVERPPTLGEVRAAAARFVGVIEQAPPAFSAIKVGGRRSYDLARQGKEIALASRPVEIKGIEVVRYEWPRVTLDVVCGKGTYIRSLARDLGKALGVGGCLAGLRRTAVMPFTIAEAVGIDAVPDPLRADDPVIRGVREAIAGAG